MANHILDAAMATHNDNADTHQQAQIIVAYPRAAEVYILQLWTLRRQIGQMRYALAALLQASAAPLSSKFCLHLDAKPPF